MCGKCAERLAGTEAAGTGGADAGDGWRCVACEPGRLLSKHSRWVLLLRGRAAHVPLPSGLAGWRRRPPCCSCYRRERSGSPRGRGPRGHPWASSWRGVCLSFEHGPDAAAAYAGAGAAVRPPSVALEAAVSGAFLRCLVVSTHYGPIRPRTACRCQRVAAASFRLRASLSPGREAARPLRVQCDRVTAPGPRTRCRTACLLPCAPVQRRRAIRPSRHKALAPRGLQARHSRT